MSEKRKYDATVARIAGSGLRRELQRWIDCELLFYVRGFISDDDYAKLRKNMIDIAVAYANSARKT